MFYREVRVVVVSDDRRLTDMVAAAAREKMAECQVEVVGEFVTAEILPHINYLTVVLLDGRRDLGRVARFGRSLRTYDAARITPIVFLVDSVSDELADVLHCPSTDFLLLPPDAGALASRIAITLRNSDAMQKQLQQTQVLERLAACDDLTGLYNRRYILKTLESELTSMRRADCGLCLCLIDLDHFKAVNDTCGHMAGDRVLKEFSELLTSCVRTADVLGRYGGDEFCIIKQCTSAERCMAMADRLLACLEEQDFGSTEDCPIRVTASIGIAFSPVGIGGAAHELLVAADKALYEAKAAGRNRSMVRVIGGEMVI